VRNRWANNEPLIVEGMKTLASFADQASEALENRNTKRLGELMNNNFKLRRQMYGDEVIGKLNLKMIEIAYENNAYAKFTGSGGCILILPSETTNIDRLLNQYEKEDFVCVVAQAAIPSE